MNIDTFQNSWETIVAPGQEQLSALGDNSKRSIVISSSFIAEEFASCKSPANYQLSQNSKTILQESCRVLEIGGLLWIYGKPHSLAHLGNFLSCQQFPQYRMIFKYWIALDLERQLKYQTLCPSHFGLLLLLKSHSSPTVSPPFRLNTRDVLVPHGVCSACGKNVKDWGGKKHLMNPKGSALSDIWRDPKSSNVPESKNEVTSEVIPAFAMERIKALTFSEGGTYLHLIQQNPGLEVLSFSDGSSLLHFVEKQAAHRETATKRLTLDTIYEDDCIAFLDRVSAKYPDGVFDLAFADPPYNLNKEYEVYRDDLVDPHYLKWCEKWLLGLANSLKPGGSLFVLNLPKWSMHHAVFLNRILEFRHWVAWDALSEPRGKLMPAHYSLLYFTKPGAPPVFNYDGISSIGNSSTNVQPPAAAEYCLRAACNKVRKQMNDDRRSELSDVWRDIHRIKHRRDRDNHPCQLPEKLLERIILLSTNRGDIVFDPFCGAGTSAIVAQRLGRHFVTTEIDRKYINIARSKLEAISTTINESCNISDRQSTEELGDLSGTEARLTSL